MFLQTPEGEIITINDRSPERFLVFADRLFQQACIRFGGRNIYGAPNFRLVLGKSRYELAGYMEIAQEDVTEEGGKTLGHFSGEIFQLKYDLPEGMEDAFVLEAWRPAEWYADQGREQREIRWHEHGLPITVREFAPLPRRGDYEAVMIDVDFPAPFFCRSTRLTLRKPGEMARVWECPPMTVNMIRNRIQRHREAVDRFATEAGASSVWLKRQERLREEAVRRVSLYEEMVGESMGPFALKRHSGFGGKTREIGSTATPDRRKRPETIEQ